MRMVTTYDGRQIDSSSAEWIAHCEATTMLKWPVLQRQAHFQTVRTGRGQEAHNALKNLVRAIWIARQVDEIAAMARDDDRVARLLRIEQATNSRMREDIEKALQARFDVV